MHSAPNLTAFFAFAHCPITAPNMPPKDSKDNKKQKTLMGFFSKAAAPGGNKSQSSTQSTLKSSASPSSHTSVDADAPREPVPKYAESSSPGSKSTSSGNLSEPIEVDMASGDESDGVVTKKRVRLRTRRHHCATPQMADLPLETTEAKGHHR